MVNQVLISLISIKENYEAEFNNDLANLLHDLGRIKELVFMQFPQGKNTRRNVNTTTAFLTMYDVRVLPEVIERLHGQFWHGKQLRAIPNKYAQKNNSSDVPFQCELLVKPVGTCSSTPGDSKIRIGRKQISTQCDYAQI